MDIRPRRRPPVVPARPEVVVPPPTIVESVNEAPNPPATLEEATPARPNKWLRWLLGGFAGVILLALLAAFGWYQLALRPVNATDSTRTRVSIVSGSSPTQIASTLQEKHLIRSTVAFDIYTRLTKTRAKLQAGTYSLAPSESTAAIVDHLVSGKVDQFKITFYPGGTLKAAPNETDNKKTDVQTMLLRAGFNQKEIDTAFAKTYDLSLFADKPAVASLEGYVYGDTYSVDSSTTVEQLLTTAFNEYQSVITKNDLVAAFKAQGLTLYQGITLASIIQREMGSNQADMPQVAQVFLRRLSLGMPLGSDVTYQYAADMSGVARDPTLDSPYNTRIHPGLPPGPIATPGLQALLAVAHPAAGDYLFFLSGDDNKTYFSSTDAQHEANIRDHCQVKCATP